MRTIVVFQVPGALWYCELEDLAGKPVRGSFYVHRGNRYEVTEVTESLGVNTPDGSRLRSGNEKLLEILGVLFDQQTALGLFASLTNIGSGDASNTTTGGIITISTGLVGAFDNLVFVSMKQDKKSATSVKLAGLTSAAFAQEVDGVAETGNVVPIKLTSAAAKKPRRSANRS